MTVAYGAAVLGALIALVYQAWVTAPDSAPRSALKTAPVALFAVAAVLAGAPWALVLGLALGALGDLALSRKGEAAFLSGLGAFALAHLAYVAVFIGVEGRLAPFDFGAPRWLGLALLVIVAQSTLIWLLPHTGKLRRPVGAYVAIITAMGLAALHLPAASALAIVGAGLFVASDLVLAVRLFRIADDSPAARRTSHAVWPLYWIGQGLILAGIGFA